MSKLDSDTVDTLFSSTSQIDDLTAEQTKLFDKIRAGAIPTCFRGCAVFLQSILWRQFRNGDVILQVQCQNWPSLDTQGMGNGVLFFYVDTIGSASRIHLKSEYQELFDSFGFRFKCRPPEELFVMELGRSTRMAKESYLDCINGSDWNTIFLRDGSDEFATAYDPSWGRELPVRPVSIIETTPRSEVFQRLNKAILLERIRRNDASTVVELLSADSSLAYYLDDSSNTALHIATNHLILRASNGAESSTSTILADGSPSNEEADDDEEAQQSDQTRPLDPEVNLVKALLELCPVLRSIQNKTGDTALHQVLRGLKTGPRMDAERANSLMKIALLFIESGAELELRNSKGESPLSLLSLLGEQHLCPMLASSALKNKLLFKKLLLADERLCQLIIYLHSGQPNVFEEVIEVIDALKRTGKLSPATRTAKALFDIAVRLGKRDIAQRVLNSVSVDIDGTIEIRDNPPLLMAVNNGDVEMVRFLIDKGADPTVRGCMGSGSVDASGDRNASAIDLVRKDLEKRRDPLWKKYGDRFFASDEQLAAIRTILEESIRHKPRFRIKNWFGL